MSLLWHALRGPRLYTLYNRITNEATPYNVNAIEKIGNYIINGLKFMYNIGYYSVPLIAISAMGWEESSFVSCARLGAGLALLLIVGVTIRGVGRRLNPEYTAFIEVLKKAGMHKPKSEDMELVENYDFDFDVWPVTFDWTSAVPTEKRNRIQVVGGGSSKQGLVKHLLMVPMEVVAYIMSCLIARQLIYPGSVGLFQAVINTHLQAGRKRLILQENGKRRKVVTQEGNGIDTMFVDRRKKAGSRHGGTLVVCCEGNAGFYEIGILEVPLTQGYSILGWNHPGFGASSGAPHPPQEQNAIDAVMQYALQELGFRQEDIIIYGWSIGGYCSTWAAMNYPQIGGLILDASFDDIHPLAINKMPTWLEGVTTLAIRNYFNLNPADQLACYPGPITIIRRTRDDIITTNETTLSCNLTNNLLIRLLVSRYPNLACKQSLEALHQWLTEDPSTSDLIMNQWGVDDDLCSTLLATYVNDYSEAFPIMIGEDMDQNDKTKLVLFLATKHFVDFNEGHNTILDAKLFRKPWKIISDYSYVQVNAVSGVD